MGVYREIKQETTGYQTDFTQSFYHNQFADSNSIGTAHWCFDVPLYTTDGGTTNYYAQDSKSVFTNLARPFIRFNFYENVSSLAIPGTYLIHDLYRIPYSIYKEYLANREGLASEFSEEDAINQIKEKLEEPLLSLTALTSGMTSVYDLFLPEQYKELGDYTYQLFENKDQFFIDTRIGFIRSAGTQYEDFYKLDENRNLINYGFEDEVREGTRNKPHIISAGTFIETEVVGNYFTYFLIPPEPQIVAPIVSGQLTTFTPIFYYSNAETTNEEVLQIVYDIDDINFTGIVFSYPILNVEADEEGTKRFSAPLKIEEEFRYRIGNVESLINIFDVKQSVTTFSRSYTAITPTIIDVCVESDSPYMIDIPECSGITLEDNYILSGQVYGSLVTGATVQLTDIGTGTYITQPTDSNGYFEFTELSPKFYTLRTFYRGYETDSRNINLTENIFIEYKLKLLWDNKWDTWGKMAQENYYTFP